MIEELREALAEINKVIEARKTAHGRIKHPMGFTVYEMLDTTGRPYMADLLVAKAHLLMTIASMEAYEEQGQ